MRKEGKIFTLGLMLIYLISAMTALILLSGGLSKMPEQTIGAYQAGLLAAQERAEQKLFYLESGASLALEKSLTLLYEDQRAFFSSSEGDMSQGLSCGAYTYQLWNDGEERCLGDAESLALALKPHILSELNKAAMAYPYGPFSVSYQLNIEREKKLLLSFTGEPIEEPILLGLDPGEQSEEAAGTMAGVTVGKELLWPSSGDTVITSCFGPRDYELAASNIHHGMDIGPGGMVIAARDGIVLNDPSTSTYGAVWIQHTPDFSTRYLHLVDIKVHQGEGVSAGQVLGKAGNTGCSGCGKHLHFEVLSKSLPQGSTHAYPNIMNGWYSLNPVCFFSEETLDKVSISPNTGQSCSRPDYPKPAKHAYCDEYGFASLDPVNSYTQGSATGAKDASGGLITTEESAAGDESERPTTMEDGGLFGKDFELTQEQQKKFHQTLQNQHQYGWGPLVDKAAAETGVDAALIRGVITQESIGDPLVISNTGCAGIMQWCIDKKTKEKSTAAKFFGSGAYLTYCHCSSTRATSGSGCSCTAENDRRLNPSYAIPAGSDLLKALIDRFTSYTARNAFALASYNVGEGAIFNAIRGTGERDPSWEQVANYMQKHPEVITYDIAGGKEAKVAQVVEYVDQVLAYTRAWNGGEPIDQGYTARALGDIEQVGVYKHPSAFTITSDDRLLPFLELLSWSSTALSTCASAEDPERCLLEEAASAHVETTCEVAPIDYFVSLSEAIRDCSENLQTNCQCSLPASPGAGSRYKLQLDATKRSARLLQDGTPLERLHFENLSNKALRVGEGVGIVPALFEITLADDTFQLMYQELGDDTEPILWEPGWSMEKGNEVEQVHFREEATDALPMCAPVKRMYSFCKKTAAETIRFSLTVEDSASPAMVSNVQFDGRSVSFDASSSADVAFYNVYAAARNAQPVLQLRSAGRFDASAWLGGMLWITAVDKVGNEGSAVNIALVQT